jgi:hypothetical protein
MGVVKYRYVGKLSHRTLTTLAGKHVASGCSFKPPRLTRGFGEPPVTRRQVSTNFNTCTTVLERGYEAGLAAKAPVRPPLGDVIPGDGDGNCPQSTSRYRLTWYDVVGLWVNWLQANLSYCKTSNCVTWAGGNGTHDWRWETGWVDHPMSGGTNPPSCSFRKYVTTTNFTNGAFCYPGNVTVYDNGVSAGVTPYALSGWTEETHQEMPFYCPSLHWQDQLN